MTPEKTGHPPSAEDLRKLEAESWLTLELIEAAGIRRFDERTARDVLCRNGFGEYAGLAFPYIYPGTEDVVEWRIRRDRPDVNEKGKPYRKYMTAPGGWSRLYFPPFATPEMLSNVSLPIAITEGAKKTLALWRLAWHETDNPRFLPIGIDGVWNWRGKRGIRPAPNGGYIPERGPIPDLDRITWECRTSYIVFDVNVADNEQVQWARRGLSRELRSRDASILLVTIPEIERVNGIDDFLAIEGPEKALELFEKATPTGEPDLTRFPYTDVGNAERLVELHGHNLAWIWERKNFYIFNGSRWQPDNTGSAAKLAIDTIRTAYQQATYIPEAEKKQLFDKHCRDSERNNAISAMLGLSFRGVGNVRSVTDFDRQPYLLNLANGTYDLETGRLYKPRRMDLLSCLAPVTFDREAKCPLFLAFLHRAMGNIAGCSDQQIELAAERVLFLQKGLGLSLSADVSEKVIFALFGETNTGKTTLLETIRHTLGDYGGQCKIESLLAKSEQSDNNTQEDTADLLGKRFVTTSEAEKRHKIAAGRLKYLTQGAFTKIKAARKHEHIVEFPATFKLWIDSNEPPTLPHNDNATWGRLKPLTFVNPVTGSERDLSLPAKLRRETPGIFNWAAEGFRRWQIEGLGDPPDVQEARQKWRDFCGQLNEFFKDCCEVDLGNPDLRSLNAAVWKRYEAWAKDNGERPLSRTAFGIELDRRGIVQAYDNVNGKTTRVRLHIRLLDD